MTKIKPGVYSFQDVFDLAKFDFEAAAAADYLDGAPDHRKVKVANLGFDSVDETFVVPEAAKEVVITVDGEEAAKLTVG